MEMLVWGLFALAGLLCLWAAQGRRGRDGAVILSALSLLAGALTGLTAGWALDDLVLPMMWVFCLGALAALWRQGREP